MAREGADLLVERQPNVDFKGLLACMISPKAPNEFVPAGEADLQFNAMVLEYCKQMTTSLRGEDGGLILRDTEYGYYDTQDFFGSEGKKVFESRDDVEKVHQNQRKIFNAIKSMLDSQDRTLLATIMNFDAAQAASKSDEEVRAILEECKPYLFSSISTAAALTGNFDLYVEIKSIVPSIDTPQHINTHSRLAYKHVLGASGVLSTENYLPQDARFVLEGVRNIVVPSLNLGSETPLPEGAMIERLANLLVTNLITDEEFDSILAKIKQSEGGITLRALPEVVTILAFASGGLSKELCFDQARAMKIIETFGDILKSRAWGYGEIMELRVSLQHGQIASIDGAEVYLKATFEEIFTRFMVEQLKLCSDVSKINQLQNDFTNDYVRNLALDEQLQKKIQDLFEIERISLRPDARDSEDFIAYNFSFISDAISWLGRLLSSTFNEISRFIQQQFNGRVAEVHYDFPSAAESLSSARSSIQPPPSSRSPS